MEALLAHLHTLDNHSALYILHSLTSLAQFEEHKILELLEQLPESPRTGQHLLHRHLLEQLPASPRTGQCPHFILLLFVY